MNIKKIEIFLNKMSSFMKEDMLTSKEYLVAIGNMLIKFGSANLNQNDFKNLDINNYHQVENAYNIFPDNPFLAAILQGHIVIKWSESFEE